MALNLIRNSRVFFTTNVDGTTGVVNGTGATSTNTYEIQVLEGMSFSQSANNESVGINEAGATPVRGNRSFNTSLAPVEWSLSTYVRPKLSTTVNAEESVLWNAMLGTAALGTFETITAATTPTVAYNNATGEVTISGTGMTYSATLAVGDNVVISGIAGATAAELVYINAPARVKTLSGTSLVLTLNKPNTTAISGLTIAIANVKFYKSGWAPAGGSAYSVASTHNSNVNTFQKFGLVILVDQVTYAIDNAVITQAVLDFGLEGIATIAWSGQGSQIRQISTDLTASAGSFGGSGFTGAYAQKVTDAKYLTNKLSTAVLKTVKALSDGASTIAAANKEYALALTGGSITINNNVTYITPSNIGIVNIPITYFAGARTISGSVNAYLKTGTLSGSVTAGTGALFKDMLDSAKATIEPMFSLQLYIGGSSTAATRVELDLPTTVLTIPSVSTEQVVSTTINFTAQGTSYAASASTYDLEGTNEMAVRYFTT